MTAPDHAVPSTVETPMTLTDLLAALNAGETITGNSPGHAVMHETSQEALRIAGELNSGYHPPARVRELLAELIGASQTFLPLATGEGMRSPRRLGCMPC